METNTIQIIEKFGAKLDSYIQVAAEKAGQGVEHFWPVLVKQQYYEGITILSMILFFMVLGIVLLFLNKNKPFTSEENNPRILTTAFGIVVLLISLFIFCINYDSFTKIINPEYFALQSAVKMIR